MGNSYRLASTPELHHTAQLSKPRRFPAIGGGYQYSSAPLLPGSLPPLWRSRGHRLRNRHVRLVTTTRHRQERRSLTPGRCRQPFHLRLDQLALMAVAEARWVKGRFDVR
jgi:hypothetical protein